MMTSHSDLGRIIHKVFPSGIEFAIFNCFDWLKDPNSDYNVGVHYYCDKYKLAIHSMTDDRYEYNPELHASHEQFQKFQKNDELRRQICKERGICLVEVPYYLTNDEVENLLRITLK